MKNGPEKERRWILGGHPNYNEPHRHFKITQHYGIDDVGRFRVRMQYEHFSGDNFCNGPTQYTLTRKEKISHGVSNEIETDIGLLEFSKRADVCTSCLRKGRTVYDYSGLLFEVDFIESVHLVIMEVELEDIDQTIVMPDYISDCIIAEITGNDAYSNYNLSLIAGKISKYQFRF